jgi:hypothetical protein
MFRSIRRTTFKEPKKFIKISVGVHDQTQIEAIFDYQILFGNRSDLVTRKIDYCLEAYFFLPQGFGLNEGTYSKERFYSDLRPLIRFKEPKLGYKQIIGLKEAEKSPLKIIEKIVEKNPEDISNSEISFVCDEARLLACTFISYFWRKMRKHLKKIEKASNNEKLTSEERAKIFKVASASCRHLLARVEYIVEEIEKLNTHIAAKKNEELKPLLLEFDRAREYIAYRHLDMLVHLQEKTICQSCDADDSIQKLVEETKVFANTVLDRCKNNDYHVVSADISAANREAYMARRGFLKLHIWEILHLHMRTKPVFTFQRHFGAMLAAGLAALWAVVTQIIVISEILNAGNLNDLWGVGGFFFLTAGVLAYIVKDRIKEAGRSYFRGGIWGSLPDNSERLTYGRKTPSKKPQDLGNYTETTTIIEENLLPEAVKELRTKHSGGVVSEHTSHKVICYKRDVSIKGQIIRINNHALRTVHDILRFNVSGFLGRLGDPVVDVKYFDNKGDLQMVELPKVYHLDLLLRHQKIDKNQKNVKNGMEYLRLYIDKNGLKRVERLK